MDKNSIIGLGLIFAILIGFAYFNQPNEEELKGYKQKQDSLALIAKRDDSLAQTLVKQAAKTDTLKAVDTSAVKNAFGSFAQFSTGEEQTVTLENQELRVHFTNKGGRIKSVELKSYKRSDGSPLILLDGDKNEFSFGFVTADNKAIQTKDLYFTPVMGDDGKSLAMQLKLSGGQYMEQVYRFDEYKHTIAYKLNLVGMNNVISPNANYVDLTWKQQVLQQEKTADAEQKTTTIYYKSPDEEPEYLSETSDLTQKVELPINWVSFKQQYFNASLMSETPFDKGAGLETVTDPTKLTIKTLSAGLSLPYEHEDSKSYAMKFYFGPNHYKTLEALNVDLERVIPMGWGIFRWVNQYFVVNVFNFLGQFFTNFGLIIFLLTLIIKMILFPLVYRSYLSAAKMRVLKPEIDEIKEKLGNDLTKIQQENMKLYRKAGVNPFGGCVPMLLQLPILFAQYQFFPSAFELRQKAFLWSNDLSTYDSIFNIGFEIPFYGDHVSLFTLLMTVSTLVYTLYNNQMTGVTGQMKWMSYIMPIMFLGFFNNFAAGLTYYYFVSNLITIAQQLSIRAFVDDKALHAQIQENKKKPVVKSKLQTKLEEMAKRRGIDPKKLGK